jgi:hypothetical protein
MRDHAIMIDELVVTVERYEGVVGDGAIVVKRLVIRGH